MTTGKRQYLYDIYYYYKFSWYKHNIVYAAPTRMNHEGCRLKYVYVRIIIVCLRLVMDRIQ